MLTGELRRKIDRVWDACWSGGISNPLEVVEQLTYLMFVRRLDDVGAFASATDRLRWSCFRSLPPAAMFDVVRDEVFPWLRQLGEAESAYSSQMRDARFTLPTPSLLAKVVELLDDVPLGDQDSQGDLYEYMLSKIATAGQNGQFPRWRCPAPPRPVQRRVAAALNQA